MDGLFIGSKPPYGPPQRSKTIMYKPWEELSDSKISSIFPFFLCLLPKYQQCFLTYKAKLGHFLYSRIKPLDLLVSKFPSSSNIQMIFPLVLRFEILSSN